jgi:hypothetical protein
MRVVNDIRICKGVQFKIQTPKTLQPGQPQLGRLGALCHRTAVFFCHLLHLALSFPHGKTLVARFKNFILILIFLNAYFGRVCIPKLKQPAPYPPLKILYKRGMKLS